MRRLNQVRSSPFRLPGAGLWRVQSHPQIWLLLSADAAAFPPLCSENVGVAGWRRGAGFPSQNGLLWKPFVSVRSELFMREKTGQCRRRSASTLIPGVSSRVDSLPPPWWSLDQNPELHLHQHSSREQWNQQTSPCLFVSVGSRSGSASASEPDCDLDPFDPSVGHH